MRLVALILSLFSASAGLADDGALNRLDEAFRAWLAPQGLNGVLALRHDGAPLGVIEAGISAETSIELASLSKSITGLCAMSVVEDGLMAWDDSAADTLGRGPDVSLGELITQTSGLRRDSTQGFMPFWRDQPPHRSSAVLDIVTLRAKPDGERGQFHYNNENYALAGLMIEAALGEDYDAVCRERVLEPAGVTGAASARFGGFQPWGGWAMTAADFAQFHEFWFALPSANGWDPFDLPYASAWGAHYGLGTMFRKLEPGFAFWHFGALCFPGDVETGAYAVSLFGDWTLIAAYDGCPSSDMLRKLDNALVAAALELR
ncbi:MAG: serine hydrolase domain-containing protein [Pseudomonadota bacterium]